MATQLRALNTVFKEVKSFTGFIIWSLEESRVNDPTQGHEHYLELVGSAIRNIQQGVSGVHITEVIGLGKRNEMKLHEE